LAKALIMGKKLGGIGSMMTNNPDDFMIDNEGKLFTKCSHCSDWHLISDFKLVDK